ncbi:rod shape-determining protein MreD [Defluviimonas sp. WL0024]|uniref:Rod shape-determining protein MreD n=2 Tax=Albidovulum TaxID=205889 RepID=A0ABT3J625_9RHOB|nr:MULTISPECIES: rod shape-determining protein MreD [Defluviimonas]MCU9849549.1 rod shape-determining protein MreD [Defluviimonas sp. WL0024]MCW3783118.1 rod shape-determining protein MreD [Defluviimonas salinarum]
MVDPATARRLRHCLLFLGLAAAILFARLLPLSTVPPRFPGPDLILCLALVWVMRRPDQVPALVIAMVFLVDDILAMRPPGLWALIVLLGTEFLRGREATLRDLPFAVEWSMAGALILTMMLANWFVLAVFMVPQIGLGPTVLHALATGLAYPLVLAATLAVLRLRGPARGEPDTRGGWR